MASLVSLMAVETVMASYLQGMHILQTILSDIQSDQVEKLKEDLFECLKNANTMYDSLCQNSEMSRCFNNTIISEEKMCEFATKIIDCVDSIAVLTLLTNYMHSFFIILEI